MDDSLEGLPVSIQREVGRVQGGHTRVAIRRCHPAWDSSVMVSSQEVRGSEAVRCGGRDSGRVHSLKVTAQLAAWSVHHNKKHC